MGKIILSVLLALVCVTAQADSLVYKQHLTVTRSGGNTVDKQKYTGWMFIDSAEQSIVHIRARPTTKLFNVEVIGGGWALASVSVGVKSYKVIFLEDNSQLSGLFAKGLNKHFVINSATNLFPTSFTVKGLNLFGGLGGDAFDEYRGSYSLDKKKTAQMIGLSVEQVVANLKDEFIAAGYTEVPSFF